ncbi:MAG TPA: hypothetical protein VLF91_03210 [Candidatus Saccharimonadales bacterium]|nr:hypothetical protein [Candidatus Saccharimonadales bacterium]
MIRTFPEFSKLAYADREAYEALIADYPPLCDLAFVNLQLWWNSFDGLRVSLLNGNLVICYWIPGDDERSGLALVGTNMVDQSICTIFDYLHEQSKPARIVNTPDFVIKSIRYPELFHFNTSTTDDEYVISLEHFALADNMPRYQQERIGRFLEQNRGRKTEMRRLNLAENGARELLLQADGQWPHKGFNNLSAAGREMLPYSIAQAAKLGVSNYCLFIDNQLTGYILYFNSQDANYACTLLMRLNYRVPLIFDYAVHAFSAEIIKQGPRLMNIQSDDGSSQMRALKLTLKPVEFFRKYTIEPVRRPLGVFSLN